MFFFIPINTDAPIYHWPYGTVGLIVVNTLLFFLLPNPEDFALIHGDGLHPLQWVSSNFIHSSFLHLLGNMLFLWGFGIVVEGKLGWYRFLAAYLTIGVIQCASEQMMMLGSEGGASVGASAIIYGLLAMAMVWAPRNEFTVFLFVFFFRIIATTFELSILTFGLLYVGKELLIPLLFGFHMSSQVLHLSGAAIGFGLGVLFLKMNWVDCEGWDLFSVMKKDHGSANLIQHHHLLPEAEYQLDVISTKKRKKKRKKKGSAHGSPDEDLDRKMASAEKRREKSLARIRKLLAQKKPNAAYSEYQRAKQESEGFTLGSAELERLGEALYRQKLYDQAGPVFDEFIIRFPELADQIRVKLAAILIEKQQRPRAALRTLAPVPPGALSASLEKTRLKIERKANQLIEEGVLEMESKPW